MIKIDYEIVFVVKKQNNTNSFVLSSFPYCGPWVSWVSQHNTVAVATYLLPQRIKHHNSVFSSQKICLFVTVYDGSIP